MHPLIDSVSEWWSQWMVRSLVQGTIAFVLAGGIWLAVRRFAPAEFGYRLYLLVMLGVALPISISPPGSISEHIPWKTEPVSVVANAGPVQAVSASALEFSFPADHSLKGPAITNKAFGSGALAADSLFNRASFGNVLVLIWGAFVVIGTARMIWQWVQVRSFLRSAEPIEADALPFDFEILKEHAGVPASTTIWECDDTGGGPAVSGALRPRVFVPRSVFQKLTSDQLKWAVAHELVHLGGSSYDFPGWLVLPLERFGHGSIVVFDEIEDLRV